MMDLVVRAPRLAVAGESLMGTGFATFVGGKGANQATAAARLGAEVSMIGKVGDDDFGRSILAALRTEGVDTAHVSVSEADGTGVAVPVVLDGGQNAIYAMPRANLALSARDIEAARQAIESADMLVLQFETGMDAIARAIEVARAADVPVLLNPAPVAPHPAEVVEGADIIVANEVEAAALVPAAAGDHVAESAALAALGPELAVVTLGEGGACYVAGEERGRLPAFPVDAIDSVGAGDAFCGALAVALAGDMPPSEAVRFACAAGALAVTRPGATGGLPTRAQLDAFLGGKGTFRSPQTFRVEDGDRGADTEGAPGKVP